MSDPTLVILKRGGRPLGSGTRTGTRFQFRLTTAEHTALRQVASEVQKPMAVVLREAVDEYVADYREQRVFRTN